MHHAQLVDSQTLQAIFCQQIQKASSPFDQAVKIFIEDGIVPPYDLIEEHGKWQTTLLSENKTLQNWKQLLSNNLFCHFLQSYQKEISSQIHNFENYQPWNQSSQYARALVALNHALARMPIPDVGAHLLQSGAALIDQQEYHPWLSLPSTPQHIEFGIYLCLLALLTKREDLQETVLKLAHWQLNVLDDKGIPLPGLFTVEKEGNILQNLCLYYLFFQGAALFSENSLFQNLATTLFSRIKFFLEDKPTEKISSLCIMLERFLLPTRKENEEKKLTLPERICDPSTALVGYRSSEQHVLCTLHGANTGLGYIRIGDVEIVNYGPQYLPLSDCEGFGIEGNTLSDQGIRRSRIECRPHSFTLKGCVRLVDEPGNQDKKFRGIWVDISQEFKRPHFYLNATFLSLEGWESVVFSFFVKARRCCVYSRSMPLLPRTLERYEGNIEPLILNGVHEQLIIRAVSQEGRMQIIPLGGGDNFWGADFIISYILVPQISDYQWYIGPYKS